MKKNQNIRKSTSKNKINTKKNYHIAIIVMIVFGITATLLLREAFGAPSIKASTRGLKGQVAIDVLGDKRLDKIAKKQNTTLEDLKSRLIKDDSLEVDSGDNLFYTEPASENAATNTAAAQPIMSAALPLDRTFALHSKPLASRKIYLDFNGHVTNGTYWNTYANNGQPITSAMLDTDNTPGVFSDNEKILIQNIWSRVSDDYAAYQVDVTTEEPPAEYFIKSDANDVKYGVRTIISNSTWFAGAGGVSYVGTFNYPVEVPNFVFPINIGYNDKNIAEAVTHEVGHAVGLSHDGLQASGYYDGQGSWAPIMGTSYYRNTSQFSKGEYTGASNLEDDLVKMQNYIPLENDLVADTAAGAKSLGLSGTTIADGGTIETRVDLDVYKFTASGQININVTPTTPLGSLSTNLDLKISLFDANSNQLAVGDPAGVAIASVTANVANGTYYLVVDGIGYLDPATTGYSDYGSIGAYSISGSINNTIANRAPVAAFTPNPSTGIAPLSVAFANTSSDPDGNAISHTWSFGNGFTSTLQNPSTVYNNPGTYNVTLSVRDTGGLVTSLTKQIVVNPKPIPTVKYIIYPFSLKKITANGATYVETKIALIGLDGKPIVGAKLNATWSGLYSASVSGTSDGSGIIYFRSANLKGTGNITLATTSSTPPPATSVAYTWDNINQSSTMALSLPAK